MTKNKLRLERGFGALLHNPADLENKTGISELLSATSPNPLVEQPNGYLEYAPPVRSQGNTGECVGAAVCCMLETQIKVLFNSSPLLSFQYLYNRTKMIDGAPLISGTWAGSVGAAAKRWGTVREVDYPFDISKDGQPIADLAEPEYLIDSYTVDTFEPIVFGNSLPIFGPGVVTTMVTSALWDAGPTTIIDYDPTDTKVWGAHSVCVLHDDPINKLYTIQNSWGLKWGDKGRSRVTYQFAHEYWQQMFFGTMDLSKKVTGDLNADFNINVLDAVIALNAVAAGGHVLPALQRIFDVNRDKKITVADAIDLLRHAAFGTKL